MTETELLVGLAVLVGLVGIVVPVLPGSILILGAVLVWSVLTATTTGWLVFAVVTTLLVVGGIVKYAVPGRGLRTAGVPNRTLVAGGLLGVGIDGRATQAARCAQDRHHRLLRPG